MLSTTVTDLTERTILGNDYTAISTTVGFVAVLLLSVLLLIDSVRRASMPADDDVRAPAVALPPLLISAASVVAGRLVSLL